MITNNHNESENPIPFLSEEMERTLHRLAWKDEIFREALIADPKGIIQQVFPHCFPDGKLRDDLTINVVEQDPFTRHIVLPAFADEEPILEIPEEDQSDLIVNLGELGKGLRDSYDARMRAQSAGDQRKKDWSRKQFEAKEKSTEQESTRETKKAPTEKEIAKALLDALKQDKDIGQAVKKALDPDNGGNLNGVVEMLHKKGCFPDRKLPEGVNYQLHLDTDQQWTFVISSLPDAKAYEEKQLNHIIDDMDGKKHVSLLECSQLCPSQYSKCCN